MPHHLVLSNCIESSRIESNRIESNQIKRNRPVCLLVWRCENHITFLDIIGGKEENEIDRLMLTSIVP